MFKKILIANRGEIACRIIKTAHRLGISCVAVFSEADAKAMHVKMADEAICIGPPPSQESYLSASKIIQAALVSKAEAIHPGYGFLAENAQFAEQCIQAGICFIGPPLSAISAMGSKSLAKEIMIKANIPIVPGYHEQNQDPLLLQKFATKIGYPVLLKAAAGGGGKGMRIVENEKAFATALDSAKREAKNSFGDDQILIEKYLSKPRHIEVQIFADQHGNTIHLFERDCSIQRRHQKIIEEAPAPHLNPELRQKICETAINAAQAIGYVGAGTIEFLLDSDGSFYFMEMNTRLQVEHPVTEMITQQDLVEWQLRIATGEPLPLSQGELKINGHAIEARIYAEDPAHDFLPSIGTIQYLKTPEENSYLRIDSGISQGDEITPFYDPMIAKLILWGDNRQDAVSRLVNALANYEIVGVASNIDFLAKIAANPAFLEANLSTHFIEENSASLFISEAIPSAALAIATLYLLHLESEQLENFIKNSQDPYSPWNETNNWRLNFSTSRLFNFYSNEEKEVLLSTEENSYRLQIHNEIIFAKNLQINQHTFTAIFNNQKVQADIFYTHKKFFILLNGQRYQFKTIQQHSDLHHITETKSHLTSPMPGKLVALLAKAGDEIEKGEAIAVIEAMKMEHTIHAPNKGIIKEWYFQIGDMVEEGVDLLKFEEI